ncbi:hypothetical protein GCM10010358_48280 [Streptomyces minutiscleroticus]|uniref:Uncharacterized protein n=1 Tax=Streptomyces minutiscleroticus TaxID=68238 RepID=A0A918U3X7_9ACTN|nr:hypothetical protein GCM10010358_48280 [Streptomyces minutiscleroticus]
MARHGLRRLAGGRGRVGRAPAARAHARVANGAVEGRRKQENAGYRTGRGTWGTGEGEEPSRVAARGGAPPRPRNGRPSDPYGRPREHGAAVPADPVRPSP